MSVSCIYGCAVVTYISLFTVLYRGLTYFTFFSSKSISHPIGTARLVCTHTLHVGVLQLIGLHLLWNYVVLSCFVLIVHISYFIFHGFQQVPDWKHASLYHLFQYTYDFLWNHNYLLQIFKRVSVVRISRTCN